MLPFSKHVCSFLRMLWADKFFSPVCMKAFSIIVLRSFLSIFTGFLFRCFMISGEFGVIVSGGSFLVPVFRSLMYSFIALVDSSAKKVLISSPVFCRIAW